MGASLILLAASFVVIIVEAEQFMCGVEWTESSKGTVGRMLAAAGRQISGHDPPSERAWTT
jgi:hypothetical protein